MLTPSYLSTGELPDSQRHKWKVLLKPTALAIHKNIYVCQFSYL